MTKCYKILVCFNNTPAAFKALDYAIELVQNMKCNHRLIIVYMLALNPVSVSVPYIDHLDKSYNMDLAETAEKDVEVCRKYLEKYQSKINYDFIEVEGEGETGPLIEEYINETHPDVDMVVTGSRNQGTVRRFAFGSLSDYIIHHVKAPVMVVKDTESEVVKHEQ